MGGSFLIITAAVLVTCLAAAADVRRRRSVVVPAGKVTTYPINDNKTIYCHIASADENDSNPVSDRKLDFLGFLADWEEPGTLGCLKSQSKDIPDGSVTVKFVEKGWGNCAPSYGINKAVDVVEINMNCTSSAREAAQRVMNLLGFMYETQRPDAGQFVKVKYENLADIGKLSFFQPHTETLLADTMDTSYDLTSVMHPALDFAARSGTEILEPVDASLRSSIAASSSTVFSARDLAAISRLFCKVDGCSKECRNEGYQVSDGNGGCKCKCMPGFGGDLCDGSEIETRDLAKCGRFDFNRTLGAGQAVQAVSPNSPNPYPVGVRCPSRYAAPGCKVKLTLYFANMDDSKGDRLEIFHKNNTSLPPTTVTQLTVADGPQVYTSDGEEILVVLEASAAGLRSSGSAPYGYAYKVETAC